MRWPRLLVSHGTRTMNGTRTPSSKLFFLHHLNTREALAPVGFVAVAAALDLVAEVEAAAVEAAADS